MLIVFYVHQGRHDVRLVVVAVGVLLFCCSITLWWYGCTAVMFCLSSLIMFYGPRCLI